MRHIVFKVLHFLELLKNIAVMRCVQSCVRRYLKEHLALNLRDLVARRLVCLWLLLVLMAFLLVLQADA